MRFRKLRIAWSVFSGVAAVLLIALWARSFREAESLDFHFYPRQALVIVDHMKGCVEVQLFPYETFVGPGRPPFAEYLWKGPAGMFPDRPQWRFRLPVSAPGTTRVQIPYWFLPSSLVAIGVAPWFRWRFSLRTLLITTTL